MIRLSRSQGRQDYPGLDNLRTSAARPEQKYVSEQQIGPFGNRPTSALSCGGRSLARITQVWGIRS
jgi:hypothetical protein